MWTIIKEDVDNKEVVDNKEDVEQPWNMIKKTEEGGKWKRENMESKQYSGHARINKSQRPNC